MCMDRLVCCFALCGHCAIVGGLQTASGLRGVRSSGFGVAGGGFLTASGPSETALACPIAAVAVVVHGNNFSLLARGSL